MCESHAKCVRLESSAVLTAGSALEAPTSSLNPTLDAMMALSKKFDTQAEITERKLEFQQQQLNALQQRRVIQGEGPKFSRHVPPVVCFRIPTGASATCSPEVLVPITISPGNLKTPQRFHSLPLQFAVITVINRTTTSVSVYSVNNTPTI